MKVEYTENGWKEITTVNINITRIAKRKFFEVENWLETNKRLGLKGEEFRTRCQRCKRKWEELTGNVNLVYTDKGNKALCDQCVDEVNPPPEGE